jgi:hypothetical protein
MPEHADFILSWYAIDSQGDWVYSQGYMRRARGTGKSPLAAILACIELAGPCRFGGWDENGSPIAVPEPAPWVQVMATTIEQTKPIFEIIANSWSTHAIETYGLEIGKELIVKTGAPRGKVQVIPNNPRGLRGSRPTATFVDETSELVDGNSGHQSIIRIDANLNKNPGGRARRLDLSNAFVPGEDSVAERVTLEWSDQMSAWGFSHILFDCLEANPALKLTDPDELREAIRQAAGDATWLDVERLVRAALKTSKNSVSIFRREHLNQVTSEEDSVISAQDYDKQVRDEALDLKSRFTVGFDGSLSGDGTALVAYDLKARRFHLLHYQEPNPLEEDWRVDEEQVDEIFRLNMKRLNVWGGACDMHPFESWVLGWNADFGDQMKVSASSMGPLIRDNRSARKDLTLGFESLIGEIESGKITFERNYRMKQHWLNAKTAENRYGVSFRKATPNSVHRVDIVAACLMAYLAALKIEAANIQEPKPHRGSIRGWK